MNKHLGKTIFVGAMAAFMVCANVNAAVDQATAAGDLSALSLISVQAKGNLVKAAASGDMDAIAEMSKRSTEVDTAVSEGTQAYSVLEGAIEAGDEVAADAAAKKLAEALQNAIHALNGGKPSAHQEWLKTQTNTGGGPGGADDAVFIYKKASDTATMQNVQQSTWGTFFSAGRSTGDRDATPE